LYHSTIKMIIGISLSEYVWPVLQTLVPMIRSKEEA
jgi:hypothetical protein